MKKKFLFTINNYQLGALIQTTPTDKIIEQKRIDRNHTEITYLFDTDGEREFTENVLSRRGVFKGFKR